MDNYLKNILLAGIGSMAFTYEKAIDMVDVLVKKGELTVNQGKELNEELKKVMDKKDKDDKETKEELKINEIKKILEDLPTKQDIDDIKNRLDDLEKNN
jgi:polyhydroxyalkanoate synthesis regulator phasin